MYKSAIPDVVKLPFTFQTERIANTLSTLSQSDWINHYNTRDYTGTWDVLALRSGWGHATNIYSVPMGSEHFKDTSWMDVFPDVTQILNALPCRKNAVRLMRLCAGAEIKEHCDDELDITLNKEARLHIPIQTHEQVSFYLNGQRWHLRAGECWYLNFNLPHKVVNESNVDRIHLVIDCEVNDWLVDTLLHAVSG